LLRMFDVSGVLLCLSNSIVWGFLEMLDTMTNDLNIHWVLALDSLQLLSPRLSVVIHTKLATTPRSAIRATTHPSSYNHAFSSLTTICVIWWVNGSCHYKHSLMERWDIMHRSGRRSVRYCPTRMAMQSPVFPMSRLGMRGLKLHRSPS
jgi:hypothetical protein